MARTNVPVTTLTAGTAVADPAGTAADPTNGHVIDCSAFPLEELVVRIKQTDASARVATFKAGVNPPADAAGTGDLTKSMALNEVWWFADLTSSRFIQGGSKLNIDLAASFAGTVSAFRVPRTA